MTWLASDILLTFDQEGGAQVSITYFYTPRAWLVSMPLNTLSRQHALCLNYSNVHPCGRLERTSHSSQDMAA